jgi:hypothetical protein
VSQLCSTSLCIRNAGALILKIIYGYDVNQNDDDFVTEVEQAIRHIARLVNGVYMVDYFPLCELFPLGLLRQLQEPHAILSEISSLLVPFRTLEKVSKGDCCVTP